MPKLVFWICLVEARCRPTPPTVVNRFRGKRSVPLPVQQARCESYGYFSSRIRETARESCHDKPTSSPRVYRIYVMLNNQLHRCEILTTRACSTKSGLRVRQASKSRIPLHPCPPPNGFSQVQPQALGTIIQFLAPQPNSSLAGSSSPFEFICSVSEDPI